MEVFERFWWLIFPVMGMVYGLVSMLQESRTQGRALDVLRTYAEQGKEPPPAVLEALKQTAATETSDRRQSPAVGAWWTFFVFFALFAGFGMGYTHFDGEAKTAFMIVMTVMAFLSVGAFIMAIYATFRRR